MKLKKALFPLLCLILISLNISADKNPKQKFELNLPEVINSWSLSEKPDIYAGDDLFQHINGGAEIYHEYGFIRVISGVYKNRELKSINAEIYLGLVQFTPRAKMESNPFSSLIQSLIA